jgi:hypothetical protein
MVSVDNDCRSAISGEETFYITLYERQNMFPDFHPCHPRNKLKPTRARHTVPVFASTATKGEADLPERTDI